MKVIFLDRDGVINKDPGGWTEHSYVTCWEDFHFLPGSKEAIKDLTDAGYEIVIISNQAGVNKGHFSEDDLKGVTEKMLKEIADSGGRIRSVYYCPHTKDENCACRKPETGLFEKAAEEVDVNFRNTFFIGDGGMDIEAAGRLGLKSILLLSGKSSMKDVGAWKYKPDTIKKDLREAINWILKRG